MVSVTIIPVAVSLIVESSSCRSATVETMTFSLIGTLALSCEVKTGFKATLSAVDAASR